MQNHSEWNDEVACIWHPSCHSRLTLLSLCPSPSLGVSVFMVFSDLLVPWGQGLKIALCLELSSHTLFFFYDATEWFYGESTGEMSSTISPQKRFFSGTNSCPSVIVNRNVCLLGDKVYQSYYILFFFSHPTISGPWMHHIYLLWRKYWTVTKWFSFNVFPHNFMISV